MIKVTFFAALREQLNCSELELMSEQCLTVAQVKKAIVEQHPHWQSVLENASLLSAVNHDMVNAEHLVNTGDEVAFFPPVTGG